MFGEVRIELGGMSAMKVNRMLVEAGLQTNEVAEWTMTEEGKKYGVLLYVGKKRSKGTLWFRLSGMSPS